MFVLANFFKYYIYTYNVYAYNFLPFLMSRRISKVNTVKKLIRKKTTVTLAEIRTELGAVCDLTIHQVLQKAECRTSYSHNGRYYTLNELIQFDPDGFWSHNGIRFSRNGTLTATLIALIEHSSDGLFSRDLQSMVKVDVLVTLTRLSKEGRVSRIKTGRRYLYVSGHRTRRQQQRRKKREWSLEWNDSMEQATRTLLGTLNEKDRRLFAGWVSIQLGRGGDRKAAQILKMARATILKGRNQLLADEFEKHRIRKPGGGRKLSEKKP